MRGDGHAQMLEAARHALFFFGSERHNLFEHIQIHDPVTELPFPIIPFLIGDIFPDGDFSKMTQLNNLPTGQISNNKTRRITMQQGYT